jgi:acyl carrier protein
MIQLRVLNNPAELEEALKDFIIDSLFVDMPRDQIRNDMALGTEVGVDSLGFTEILAFLEDSWGIRIADAEFTPENFRTIDLIVALAMSKQAATL